MTLPAQLRDLADRLEAAAAMKRAALDDLVGIAHYAVTVLNASPDSASVLVADGDQAGASAGVAQAGSSGSPVPPTDEPGQVPTAAAGGGKPVPAFDPLGPKRSARSLLPKGDRKALSPAKPKPVANGTMRPCPQCDREFASGQALTLHRTRAHSGATWSTKPDPAPPTPTSRATPGARLAARDAARIAPRPARSPAPAAGVTRPARNGAAPVMRKGTESWVCSRCPDSFRTREARDLHQEADHDSEPRRLPVGEPQPVFDTSGGGLP